MSSAHEYEEGQSLWTEQGVEWIVYYTDDDIPYYYCPDTQETVWEVSFTLLKNPPNASTSASNGVKSGNSMRLHSSFVDCNCFREKRVC
jgi:hypothetical protein